MDQSNLKMKTNQQIKADRFKIVAARRVQKVIDSLDSLGKCSNINNYQYNQEEVMKMMKIIKEKVKDVNALFSLHTPKGSEPFKF